MTGPTAPTGETLTSETLAQRTWKRVDTTIDEITREMAEVLPGDSPQTRLLFGYARQLDNVRQHAYVQETTTSALAADYITLLLLEAPNAAVASYGLYRHSKDKKTGGEGTLVPTQKAEFKQIMSQFNHDLVIALSHMPPSMAHDFEQQFMDRHAAMTEPHKKQLATFRPESLARIIRGMSREIAFLRAFLTTELPEDLVIQQATVQEDGLGYDFRVMRFNEANELLQELRIDTKSRGGFDRRMTSLLADSDHPLEQAEFDQAMAQRYFYDTEYNVYIVDADQFGEITNFQYDTPENAVTFVARLFGEHTSVEST